MTNIFDNRQNHPERHLLPELQEKLRHDHVAGADFCVGYFNLRGWSRLAEALTAWQPAKEQVVRLIIGKQIHDDLRVSQAYGLLTSADKKMDLQTANQLACEAAKTFSRQLSNTPPTAADVAGLRLLKAHVQSGLLKVKFFAPYPLHAKMYLVKFKPGKALVSALGYVGSSNLTLSGLSTQGELTVGVQDSSHTRQMAEWFEEHWENPFCLDMTEHLLKALDESWASERGYTPYEIYLKMVYHLASEARAGMAQYALPAEFEKVLLPFQKEAVKIAARYLYVQGGVLLGDVVGLGKTLMATALAKLFEEDTDSSTVIVCPPNLVDMWEGYVRVYGLRGLVVSTGQLDGLKNATARHRLLIVDESHNLRNPDSQRYKQLQEFIDQSDCKCILLSATPYNKSYLDLAAQIGLFWDEAKPLPIRPERLLRDLTDMQRAELQADPHTLTAFKKSPHAEDWRELMRLFLVRRTRAFIKAHYAAQDERGYYLTLPNGQRAYFPQRVPRTLTFAVSAQYARLYADPVVDAINALHLPRYGLMQYLQPSAETQADKNQQQTLKNLSRAGKRLIAYCRIGLFKRLESSGAAFLLSLKRHVARNAAVLYALERRLEVPIGQPDPALLDARLTDSDEDETAIPADPRALYERYADNANRQHFDWLPAAFFRPALADDLRADNQALTAILEQAGPWQAAQDAKLASLFTLLTRDHPNDKVLIFSQYADTVHYLTEQLAERGLQAVESVTGAHPNPASVAARFSPSSNPHLDASKNKKTKAKQPAEPPIRVLVTTDVLSEGQNLQEAHVVVNFDLPWAIIRLIQRAGRVDRIGQQADKILCYSFVPAEGVERLIDLRGRVLRRLRENGEVLGSDETFFEEQSALEEWRDLYAGRAGILDDRLDDDDTDPASGALALWQAASQANPAVAERVQRLSDGVFSAKARAADDPLPPGALVYARSASGLDVLGRVDEHGRLLTESPLAALRSAACALDTPAIPLAEKHHDLVIQAARDLLTLPSASGAGQLGKDSGVRARVYKRLSDHYNALRAVHGPRWVDRDLEQAIDQIYNYPLRQSAHHALHRQLMLKITTPELAELVKSLFVDGRLCQLPHGATAEAETARVLCSLGLG